MASVRSQGAVFALPESELRVRLLGADMELFELSGETEDVSTKATVRNARREPEFSVEDLVRGILADFEIGAKTEKERVSRLGLPDSKAKANLRKTYLDRWSNEECQRKSMDFFRRREDMLRSMTKLTLYSMLVMQHLLDLDVAGVSLPPHLRCSEDTYDDDGVNQQFRLDAVRSRYAVAGEVFDFAKACAVEAQEVFISRLVSAVLEAVPRRLVSHVTTAMSQSGCAALERASLYECVVAGGKHEVEYTVASDSCGATVTLQVSKHGFREFFAGSSGDEPCACDPGSSLVKRATIFFSNAAIVDVLNFSEELRILQDGEILPAEFFLKLPDAISGRAPHTTFQRALTCVRACLQCCFGCCQDTNREMRTPAFVDAAAE